MFVPHRSISNRLCPLLGSAKLRRACLCGVVLLVFAVGAKAQFGLKKSLNPKVISLVEAVQLAEQNNKDLLVARAQLDQQKGRLRRNYALYLPKLTLNGTYTFNFPEIKASLGSKTQNLQQAQLFDSVADLLDLTQGLRTDGSSLDAATAQSTTLRQGANALRRQKTRSFVIQPSSVFEANLTLTQPLLNLEALAAIRNSTLETDRIELSYEAARVTAYMDVAKAYYQAIKAERAVYVAQNNLKRSQALFRRAHDKFALGLASKTDSQRFEIEVLNAKEQLSDAKLSYDSALASLGLLLGVEESFLINPQIPVQPIEKSESIDNLIASARSSRDDLRSQRAALRAAQYSHQGNYASFFPVINLIGQGFYTSNTSGFVSKAFRGAILLQGTWDLYDGGDRYGRLRETRAQIRLEEAKVRDIELHVDSEVRGRIMDIENKVRALASSEKTLRLRRAIFAHNQETYKQGLVDVTDLVNASHDLSSIELEKDKDAIDLDLARLDLANVAGRLKETICR